MNRKVVMLWYRAGSKLSRRVEILGPEYNATVLHTWLSTQSKLEFR